MCRRFAFDGVCQRQLQWDLRVPERNTVLCEWRVRCLHRNHHQLRELKHVEHVQQRLVDLLHVPERNPDLLWRRVRRVHERVSAHLQR